MKLTTFEKRLLTFCALIILIFSYLLYDDSIFFSDRKTDTAPIAELVEKREDVRLKFSESFSWVPARSEEKLFPYDSVFTGDNSTAIMKLQDGSILRIDGQSLIVLSMYQGQLVLDLKSGSLSGDLSQNSNLLLKTKEGFQNLKGRDGKQFRFEKDFAGQNLQRIERNPAQEKDQIIWKSPKHFQVNKQDPRTYQNLSWMATSGIKETIIEISATEDFSLVDKVMKTQSMESGLPFDLPDGQYYVRLKGYNANRKQTAVSVLHSFEMLDKKRSSLPPPILLTQNIQHSDSYDFPPVIKWEGVDLAQKYRVELSNSPRFEQVIHYETGQSFYPWTSFRPGTYFVRLYSMADQDISLPSDIGTIEIMSQAPQLAPIPQVVIRSHDKSLVGPQKVDLRWNHTGKQSGYRIEVSRDGTFRDARILQSVRGPASMNVMNPGDYHVRVFATNADGQTISPSSNVERFRYDIKNLLPSPQLIRPFGETTVFLQQDDNPYLWLDWKPVADAEAYNVQVATDENFTRVIASESTNLNRFLIANKIPYGQYYWRVKSVSESEKIDSDWSKPYRFYLIHKKREIFFE